MRRISFPSARTLTLTAVTALAVAGLTGAGPARAATTGSGALDPGPAAVATTSDSVLATGEQVHVAVSPSGRISVQAAATASTGPAASLQLHRIGKSVYVIPTTAVPYLGRLLDVNLFNVSALAAAGGSSRVPVRVSFTGTVPSIPGVTLTSTAAGAASGYLTPASARAFGAAVAAQFAADAAAHWPARTSLFGATKISADVTIPPVITPLFPMRTLIVHVVDAAGAPVPFGFISLLNVDDARKYNGFAIVVDGEARVSVPLGNYSGVTFIDSLDAAGNFLGVREDAVGEYAVSAQNQVLTFDARHATARLSVSAPKPAGLTLQTFDWNRTDATGFGGSGSSFISDASPVFVTPEPAATVGTLTSDTAFTLLSSPSVRNAYRYDAAFAAVPGVAANQAYAIRSGQLQTVDARYYADAVARQGQLARLILNPGSFGGISVGLPLALPSNQTEYLSGAPGAVSLDTLFASPDTSVNPFAGLVADAPRLVVPGRTRTADWLRAPQLPQVPVVTDGEAAFGFSDCAACRSASTLRVVVDPAQDTTPGHGIAVFANPDGTPVARFQVFQNGTSIFDGNDVVGAELAVPAGAATYRVVDDVDRGPSLALQSVVSHTELTFRSSASSGDPLPASIGCSLAATCTALPILRADVVLPVNGVGTVPRGTSTIRLRLSHLQGAEDSKITSGTVEVRFPGHDWVRLPASGSGGTVSATLTTTAAQAGQSVDLRVSGTDAVGGSIIQSVTRAFAVA